jgi:hypothetical protein
MISNSQNIFSGNLINMRIHRSRTYLFVLVLMAVTNAEAGTIANNAWTPSTCGPAPVAPKVESRNDDAFNRSVDAVNSYRKVIRTYQDCLIQEANSDIQTISKSAKDLQQTTRDADEKIVAEVKAADKKLGK